MIYWKRLFWKLGFIKEPPYKYLVCYNGYLVEEDHQEVNGSIELLFEWPWGINDHRVAKDLIEKQGIVYNAVVTSVFPIANRRTDLESNLAEQEKAKKQK